MECHCMRSYSLLAIKTCHRRGAHAIGGMAAQIPIRGDEAANRAALDKVRADKKREAGDGHDGTWVAHPGLVAIAKEEFDAAMPGANQIERARDDVTLGADDLLEIPEGAITEAGVRLNVTVGIRYIESWLRGNGCVPLFNLMEDAATAEISRAQLWQWLRHGATLDDGRTVDAALVGAVIAEEVAKIRAELGEDGENRLDEAVGLFETVATAPDFAEFLTLAGVRQDHRNSGRLAMPTLAALEEAADLVHRTVPPTPERCWPLLAERYGCELWVKHENHTPIGSFKVRGGLVYMDALRQREPDVTGVIAATRGNHGQSVAFAATRAGLTATVVAPRGNSVEKNRAMRAFGAELIEEGHDFQAAYECAFTLAEERGLHMVRSYDPTLALGVASYTLEFLRGVPDLETLYVPIGLGSGICGAIAARDALGCKTRIVGVVAADAPTYAKSFAAGEPVPTPRADTFADGLATPDSRRRCARPHPQGRRTRRRGLRGRDASRHARLLHRHPQHRRGRRRRDPRRARPRTRPVRRPPHRRHPVGRQHRHRPLPRDPRRGLTGDDRGRTPWWRSDRFRGFRTKKAGRNGGRGRAAPARLGSVASR